jgi:hypothetical protein
MAHELFHNLQAQLIGGGVQHQWDRGETRGSTPAWLSEGSAELAAKLMLDWAGLWDYEYELQQIRRREASNRPDLANLDFRTATNPYQISLLAADLLSKDLSEYAAFYSDLSDGTWWGDAFVQAFGRTVEAFYEEFAAYREESPGAGLPTGESAAGRKVSFLIGPEVSPEIKQSIIDAATGTEEFLSSLGFPFDDIPIHVYANYDLLLEAYALINSIDITTADLHWQRGSVVTMFGDRWSLFINLSSSGWAERDKANQALIVAQEVFSVLQFQQRKGSLYAEGDQVPSGGPRMASRR